MPTPYFTLVREIKSAYNHRLCLVAHARQPCFIAAEHGGGNSSQAAFNKPFRSAGPQVADSAVLNQGGSNVR